MDFSTIAKRTRSRDPEYYRWLHEKLRNERDRASANGDGHASSSEARSGSSAGQSVGGGRSSTDTSRGGDGRSTGPSTSHNVLDYEDEEEEQRMLKKRRPIISNKTTQKNKGRREAHKKILESRSMGEAISMEADDNIAFSENQNASADVEVEGQETFVGLEDVVEVELITAKKRSNSNIVGESAYQAHGHDSEDAFVVPIKQNSSVDIEVQARRSSVDLEEEEVQIVAEKPSTTKRVRVKQETIYIIDLEQEAEETVAAEKSIVIEPTHQAPGSGSGIAFSENQNATAVDEKRAC